MAYLNEDGSYTDIPKNEKSKLVDLRGAMGGRAPTAGINPGQELSTNASPDPVLSKEVLDKSTAGNPVTARALRTTVGDSTSASLEPVNVTAKKRSMLSTNPANDTGALAAQGVTDAKRSPLWLTGRTGNAAAENLAGIRFDADRSPSGVINLGNRGVKDGPDIFARRGKSGETEFIGAGQGDPAGPVNNGILAPPPQLRSPTANFGGGAGQQSANILREIRSAGKRAQKAFQSAVDKGYSVGGVGQAVNAALAGTSDLVNAHGNILRNQASNAQTDAIREGTQANLARNLRQDQLGQETEFAKLNAKQQSERAEQLDSLFRGQFTQLDPETGQNITDEGAYSRALARVGGLDTLVQLPTDVGRAFLERGINVDNILKNVNKSPAFKNRNIRVEELGQLLNGDLKLEQSDAKLIDILRSENLNLLHWIGNDKFKLGDGTLIAVKDFFGLGTETEATFSGQERDELIDDARLRR